MFLQCPRFHSAGKDGGIFKNATLAFEIKGSRKKQGMMGFLVFSSDQQSLIRTQRRTCKEMHKTFNTTQRQLRALSTLLAPPLHSFKSSFVYSSGTHPAQGCKLQRADRLEAIRHSPAPGCHIMALGRHCQYFSLDMLTFEHGPVSKCCIRHEGRLRAQTIFSSDYLLFPFAHSAWE